MKSDIYFLDEINSKYADAENEIEQKIKKLQLEELKFAKVEQSLEVEKTICDSFQKAKFRNSEILKSLGIVKARLRSRSTFSPIETILKKAKKNYEKEYALIPISNN